MDNFIRSKVWIILTELNLLMVWNEDGVSRINLPQSHNYALDRLAKMGPSIREDSEQNVAQRTRPKAKARRTMSWRSWMPVRSLNRTPQQWTSKFEEKDELVKPILGSVWFRSHVREWERVLRQKKLRRVSLFIPQSNRSPKQCFCKTLRLNDLSTLSPVTDWR